MKSKWLDWQPGVLNMAETQPTEPTKPGSVGFEGTPLPLFSITRASEAIAGLTMEPLLAASTLPKTANPAVTTVDPGSGVCAGEMNNAPKGGIQLLSSSSGALNSFIPGTKIPLPVGVRVISYTSSRSDTSTQAGVKIVDKIKFVKALLADLDARLNHPIQIRGGGSVFEILQELADVGLELAIERPKPVYSDPSMATLTEDPTPIPEGAQVEGGAL